VRCGTVFTRGQKRHTRGGNDILRNWEYRNSDTDGRMFGEKM
jgi:hypothetical protein